MDCNRSLEKVYLSNNRITARGAQRLAKSLTERATIKCLAVSKNFLEDEGAAIIAEALVENNTLSALNLSENNLREKSMSAIGKALAENTTLEQLDIFGSYGAPILRSPNNTLTLLDLGGTTPFSEELFRLTKIQGMHTLNLTI